MRIGPVYHCDAQLYQFMFQLPRYKTLTSFLRIVKVAMRVALVLLDRYNVQSNAERTLK